ncbi:Hsp70 protein [Encephalitozoon hellem]|nr:Hsp70 protein [Encephalitozoon hellem]
MPNANALNKKLSSNIIGIDLGTTNSCVSVVKNGEPVIIENQEGERTTPSVVSILKDEVLVGSQSKSKILTHPKNTVFASKRLIGRKLEDPEVKKYVKGLPFDTTSHCNGDVWIKVDGKKYSPAQIGAFILSKLKRSAESFLNHSVVKSVITVPAYFNDSQRQATKDAGRIAGLDVVRVINEPTAAALAYGLDKSARGNIAVYDLGGGTFDISILELSDGVFHVKATNGDTFLGGEDLDNEVVRFIVKDFMEKEGIDLGRDVSALARIKECAEKVKKDLSSSVVSRIDIPYICNVGGEAKHLSREITRSEFEKIVEKIVNRTIEPCKKALADAGLDSADIKHVILVGGMTRMPYVRKVVKEIFGIEPSTEINPDEAVAKGAALQGGVLAGEVDNVLLLDVAPLSLGIELLGGVFSKIIRRNTTIPFKETQIFSTSEDNQTDVDIKVYQGERAMAADNKYLGQIRLKNIPPLPRGVPKIEVTFESDANGMYRVTAQDSVTRTPQSLEIIPSSGLTEKEIDRMVREGEELRNLDEMKRRKAEVTISVGELLRRGYNELGKAPEDSLSKLRKVAKGEDFDLEETEQILLDVKKAISK